MFYKTLICTAISLRGFGPDGPQRRNLSPIGNGKTVG